MIVNYLLQIRAFDDYRMYETKLSSGQVSLWYTLMSINNKAHWQKWFTAANVVLERLSGLSRSGIVKNRNILKQLGLIDFQSNGRKATSYQVCVLYTSDSTQRSTQSSTQDSAQRSTQDSAQNSSTLVKHKQNKTEKKKEKSRLPSGPFRFFLMAKCKTVEPSSSRHKNATILASCSMAPVSRKSLKFGSLSSRFSTARLNWLNARIGMLSVWVSSFNCRETSSKLCRGSKC